VREDGHFEIISEKGSVEGSTLQCGHCGCHFAVNPGSGRKRGFCLKCMKVTCGSQGCLECNPVEKRLEQAEARARLRCH
jgi:hypothetical protein